MPIGLRLRALELQRDNALSAMPVSVCVCARNIVLMVCEELLVMISHPYPWWPLGPRPSVDTILLYTHTFGMKDNPLKKANVPTFAMGFDPRAPPHPFMFVGHHKLRHARRSSFWTGPTFTSFEGLLFFFVFVAFQCDQQP